MPSPWILAVVGLIFTVSYLVSRSIAERRYQAKAAALGCKLPYIIPNTLPLGLDHVYKLIQKGRSFAIPDMYLEQADSIQRFTWATDLIGTRLFLTTEPKNMQALHATQFADFWLGHWRRANFIPLLGDGIFTQDGKAWEHSRALLRPQFAREQLSDLDLEERHVQNMMQAIKIDAHSGWTDEIDLQPVFFRLTLDTATEFLFGESADSQIAALPGKQASVARPDHDHDGFAQAFDASQFIIAERFRLANLYWLYNPASFGRNNKICHDYVNYYIDMALSDKMAEEKKEGPGQKGQQGESGPARKEKYVFLEALVAETRDRTELRAQLSNILIAGRDSTASLLGWVFFLLARHPAEWSKLRSVVLAEFGTYTNPDEISFTKLKACQYLQYCLNEAQRLFVITPLNLRVALRDTTLPIGGGEDQQSPIFLRKGDMVQYSFHVMHHRKDIWGEDAEDFRPQRWHGRKHGWDFLPFGGGPRTCLGQQLALTEAAYVTVRLMQRFDRIENMDPELKAKHDFKITNRSANGAKVKLHEASE